MARIYGNQCLLVTPFGEDGKFDQKSYQKLIDYVMSEGVHGILALGTTGEFFSMAEDEWKEIMDVTAKELAGKIPLGFGCGHSGTKEAVKMAQYAESVGGEYLLVTPPYYFQNTPEGILDHYRTIAKSVKIDLMLYDGGGGVDLPVQQLVELSEECENIKYVKLFTQDVEKVGKVVAQGKGNITPIAGHSHVFYLQLLYGADGMTTAASNIFPKENTLIYNYIKDGKLKEAREIHNKVMAPWNDVCFPSPLHFIQCYKKALEWKGIIANSYVRLPLRQIDAVREKELKEVLKYLQWL